MVKALSVSKAGAGHIHDSYKPLHVDGEVYFFL